MFVKLESLRFKLAARPVRSVVGLGWWWQLCRFDLDLLSRAFEAIAGNNPGRMGPGESSTRQT